MPPPRPAVIARRDQMYPTLTPAEIDRLRRFGEARTYAPGEALVRVGEPGHGLTVILSGEVAVTRRDEGGVSQPIVTHAAGSFMGELAQLTGRPSLVDASAQGPVDALVMRPEGLRALLIGEAELGERIMRALILRRVRLIEEGRRRPGDRRPRRPSGRAPAGGLPRPQRPSAHRARFRPRRGGQGPAGALPRAAGRVADRALPGRAAAAQSQRGRAGALHRHGRRDRPGQGVRRGHRRRGAGGPGGVGLCGVGGAVGPDARLPRLRRARPAPLRGSRTTSASPRGSAAWP
ncbi:MAG: cyclic nucleotide-binding domain-containing protein [Caulobacteraceae bacterium]